MELVLVISNIGKLKGKYVITFVGIKHTSRHKQFSESIIRTLNDKTLQFKRPT